MHTPIPPNRASFDARAAAQATGGRVSAESEHAKSTRGLVTDSRSVGPGCGFVALRGKNHDGHDYLRAAVAAGATLLVVERGRAPAGLNAEVVEVEDTLVAWGALAHSHVRRWRDANQDARLVAITGSAGKTTTKELCAALLRGSGACHSSPGNLNNRVGVPAVALALEDRHRFAVLELGMNQPGEIAALASIVEPDVAVITNVGLAHAGGVGGNVEDVAREKGAIFAGVRAGGTVVANADDPAVMAQVARAASAKVVLFGLGEGVGVRLSKREPLGTRGSGVTLRSSGRESAFVVPIPGEAAAVDFAAALAAAEAAAGEAFDDAQVERALGALAPIAGRMQLRRLRDDILVIDDSYNANPSSMVAALGALGDFAGARRVAVLGEMKELGPASRAEHERLGLQVARARVEVFISCGGFADVAGQAAESAGVDVRFAENVDHAARLSVELVRPGDRVLVKGSRGVHAEVVADALVSAHGEELA